eukprot:g3820.t1
MDEGIGGGLDELSSNGTNRSRSRRLGPDYTEEKVKCKTFLRMYKSNTRTTGTGRTMFLGPKYLHLIKQISRRRLNLLVISLDDVADFGDDGEGEMLARNIERNAKRYVKLMCEAVDEILKDDFSSTSSARGDGDNTDEEDADIGLDPDDPVDIFMANRIDRTNEMSQSRGLDNDETISGSNSGMPPELLRRYEVVFQPRSDTEHLSIRQIGARHIGRLVKIRGMITKVTDVKPLVSIVTYTCDMCGNEIYQEVKKRNFVPLRECPSQTCTQNNQSGRLFMMSRGCKFVKYQTAKMQELPNQVPVGHIPRVMNVNIRGELARSVLPGDVVTLGGCFLPIPYTGFRAIRAGLVTDTYLEAMHIAKGKHSYADMTISRDMEEDVDMASEEKDIFTKLARSIAPEIYGMIDVKKALLLQLVGGCTRQLPDGMRIRGDINICLVGDPGMAKSQLLKAVSLIAPRCVYTTGKGSSGVGLTAAVNRDTLTGETVLEGGALVLADMGICCIDEFDKMEESDRTAIHEVMEQQTVSIAKGGITTTLNARTAILAAANPLYGRYNLAKSPAQNINLETALLSRFDLIFLLLDKSDEEQDRRLAEHITYVHRECSHPDLEFEPYKPEFLRAYISMARRNEPYVPPELASKIVNEYVELRKTDQEDSKKNKETHSMTARMLLSILRLAQALARILMHSKVCEEDIDEAIRILRVTRAQLVPDEEEKKDSKVDPVSAVYELVMGMMGTRGQIKYDAAEKAATANGYSTTVFTNMLEQYDKLDVLRVNK